jgi:hypothetical protein
MEEADFREEIAQYERLLVKMREQQPEIGSPWLPLLSGMVAGAVLFATGMALAHWLSC